ncbi:MAG: PAS domain-containing sensor histidine kinase [Gemmatimonadetes bacterium]|nr:PAS domain-containing sensor histidine kinase [Gemmatimonadota bacterium]
MTTRTLQSALARWGWILPILAFLLLLTTTFYLDQQNRRELTRARQQAAARAEEDAAALSETISSAMAGRIGALAAAKLQFTQVQDSLSQQTFLVALDSVIAGVPGLTAVTVITGRGGAAASSGALLYRTWLEPLTIPAVEAAYGKAVATGGPATTGMLQLLGGSRVLVFDPIPAEDGESLRAVLAAEIDPLVVIRAALERERSRLRPTFYALYDPEGTRVTTVPSPEGWERVTRPVQVGDREWTLAVAHPPVSARSFEMVSGAIRISGLLLALAFALSLFLLWRTVRSQQTEIQRRIQAERNAAESAEEAARRAQEARSLSEQLESAQETALRLSGSLAPENVMDEFLGAVGEVVGGDLALLYGFDEDGDQVVGRHRVVLSPGSVPPEAASPDDFRQVRVPVALLGELAEPIATGEPVLTRSNDLPGASPAELGLARPLETLAVPLKVGGHLVGLAVWHCYREGGFAATSVPFARTVAAHAAANLRAAELLEGVRRARGKATREATRLATVLERLADGVVLFDRSGRPERVNEAAQALLGPRVSKAELREWPAHFRTGQGGRIPSEEPFALLAALEGRRVDRFRFTLTHSGIERYLAASAAPIMGEDEEVRGVAVVVRDVTDEHEYAEILRHTNDELREQTTLLERANDELTAATLAKDQFLAMMSHELRTPLNAIIGYADLLDMGVHGTLAPKQKQMVLRVVETSRHLLGLINDVLDLTKVAAGRLDLTLEPVVLRPVLMRAANQVSPLADSKSLEVRVDAPDDVVVVADETRLAQVLINLAANAVKFTESGSVTISFEDLGGSGIIHVADTGPGIPPHELERIFEEFHQVDSGHSRRAGGTGLGLAISRRLARLMGGDLRVRSVVGEGTDFMLELPITEGRATERTADRAAATGSSRRTATGGSV